MATFPDAPDEVQAEINDLIEIIEASVDEVFVDDDVGGVARSIQCLSHCDLLCDEVRGPSIIAESSRFRLFSR